MFRLAKGLGSRNQLSQCFTQLWKGPRPIPKAATGRVQYHTYAKNEVSIAKLPHLALMCAGLAVRLECHDGSCLLIATICKFIVCEPLVLDRDPKKVMRNGTIEAAW